MDSAERRHEVFWRPTDDRIANGEAWTQVASNDRQVLRIVTPGYPLSERLRWRHFEDRPDSTLASDPLSTIYRRRRRCCFFCMWSSASFGASWLATSSACCSTFPAEVCDTKFGALKVVEQTMQFEFTENKGDGTNLTPAICLTREKWIYWMAIKWAVCTSSTIFHLWTLFH